MQEQKLIELHEELEASAPRGVRGGVGLKEGQNKYSGLPYRFAGQAATVDPEVAAKYPLIRFVKEGEMVANSDQHINSNLKTFANDGSDSSSSSSSSPLPPLLLLLLLLLLQLHLRRRLHPHLNLNQIMTH